MTTAETISSAVQCASGLKGVVSYACAEGYAAENREAIAAGRIAGLEFPAPKERKKRVTTSDRNKVLMVKKVNALRDEGRKKADAVEECGTTVSSYEKWSVKFGINHTEEKVDKHPHDVAIANLVREGETVEHACSTFGLKSEAWRYRAIKKGLYKSNNRNRPKEYYAERVSVVKLLVRETGCTIRSACKQIGFQEYNYNRFKLLVD